MEGRGLQLLLVAVTLIADSRPEPDDDRAFCTHGNVLRNFYLEGSKRTNNFTYYRNVTSMFECVRLCCIATSCDLAFMKNNKCFGVDCGADSPCQVTHRKSSQNETVLITFVTKGSPRHAPRKGKKLRKHRTSRRRKHHTKPTRQSFRGSPLGGNAAEEEEDRDEEAGDDHDINDSDEIGVSSAVTTKGALSRGNATSKVVSNSPISPALPARIKVASQNFHSPWLVQHALPLASSQLQQTNRPTDMAVNMGPTTNVYNPVPLYQNKPSTTNRNTTNVHNPVPVYQNKPSTTNRNTTNVYNPVPVYQNKPRTTSRNATDNFNKSGALFLPPFQSVYAYNIGNKLPSRQEGLTSSRVSEKAPISHYNDTSNGSTVYNASRIQAGIVPVSYELSSQSRSRDRDGAESGSGTTNWDTGSSTSDADSEFGSTPDSQEVSAVGEGSDDEVAADVSHSIRKAGAFNEYLWKLLRNPASLHQKEATVMKVRPFLENSRIISSISELVSGDNGEVNYTPDRTYTNTSQPEGSHAGNDQRLPAAGQIVSEQFRLGNESRSGNETSQSESEGLKTDYTEEIGDEHGSSGESGEFEVEQQGSGNSGSGEVETFSPFANRSNNDVNLQSQSVPLQNPISRNQVSGIFKKDTLPLPIPYGRAEDLLDQENYGNGWQEFTAREEPQSFVFNSPHPSDVAMEVRKSTVPWFAQDMPYLEKIPSGSLYNSPSIKHASLFIPVSADMTERSHISEPSNPVWQRRSLSIDPVQQISGSAAVVQSGAIDRSINPLLFQAFDESRITDTFNKTSRESAIFENEKKSNLNQHSVAGAYYNSDYTIPHSLDRGNQRKGVISALKLPIHNHGLHEDSGAAQNSRQVHRDKIPHDLKVNQSSAIDSFDKAFAKIFTGISESLGQVHVSNKSKVVSASGMSRSMLSAKGVDHDLKKDSAIRERPPSITNLTRHIPLRANMQESFLPDSKMIAGNVSDSELSSLNVHETTDAVALKSVASALHEALSELGTAISMKNKTRAHIDLGAGDRYKVQGQSESHHSEYDEVHEAVKIEDLSHADLHERPHVVQDLRLTYHDHHPELSYHHSPGHLPVGGDVHQPQYGIMHRPHLGVGHRYGGQEYEGGHGWANHETNPHIQNHHTEFHDHRHDDHEQVTNPYGHDDQGNREGDNMTDVITVQKMAKRKSDSELTKNNLNLLEVPLESAVINPHDHRIGSSKILIRHYTPKINVKVADKEHSSTNPRKAPQQNVKLSSNNHPVAVRKTKTQAKNVNRFKYLSQPSKSRSTSLPDKWQQKQAARLRELDKAEETIMLKLRSLNRRKHTGETFGNSDWRQYLKWRKDLADIVKERSDIIVHAADKATCRRGPTLEGATIRGGILSGEFTSKGVAGSQRECVAICCANPHCDVAMMVGKQCINVRCYRPRVCELVPSGLNSIYQGVLPVVTQVRRVAVDRNVKRSEITHAALALAEIERREMDRILKWANRDTKEFLSNI